MNIFQSFQTYAKSCSCFQSIRRKKVTILLQKEVKRCLIEILNIESNSFRLPNVYIIVKPKCFSFIKFFFSLGLNHWSVSHSHVHCTQQEEAVYIRLIYVHRLRNNFRWDCANSWKEIQWFFSVSGKKRIITYFRRYFHEKS